MEDIQTYVFQNGLAAVYLYSPTTRVFTAVLVVGAGTRFETAENRGISRFYTNICLQGNQSFPDKDKLSEAIDSLGLSFKTTVNPEYTLTSFSTIEKGFIPSLELVLKTYLQPVLDQNTLDKEKQITATEIEFANKNPQFISMNNLSMMVFNNTPLGFDILGSKESIPSITKEKLEEFKNKYYGSQNCLLVIVGPNKDFSLASLEETINIIPQGQRQHYPPFNFAQTKVIREKQSQFGAVSYLTFGSLCFGRASNKRISQSLLINILSEGRINNRLKTLQQNKIASLVRPWIKIFSDCGLFLIQTACPSAKEKEVLEAIQEQIRELGGEKSITQKELDVTKNYYQNRLYEKLDSSLENAMFYALSLFFNLPEQSPEQIMKEANKTPLAEVNEVSQTVFRPDVLSWYIVGPGY